MTQLRSSERSSVAKAVSPPNRARSWAERTSL